MLSYLRDNVDSAVVSTCQSLDGIQVCSHPASGSALSGQPTYRRTAEPWLSGGSHWWTDSLWIGLSGKPSLFSSAWSVVYTSVPSQLAASQPGTTLKCIPSSICKDTSGWFTGHQNSTRVLYTYMWQPHTTFSLLVCFICTQLWKYWSSTIHINQIWLLFLSISLIC